MICREIRKRTPELTQGCRANGDDDSDAYGDDGVNVERDDDSDDDFHYLTLTVKKDRLCGLVVRVPGYRSRGQGSIPGATRFSEK
jgi:hypothetical protein